MGTFTQKFVMYSCILALVSGGTQVLAGNGNSSKFPNVNTIGKVPDTGFLITTQVDDGVPHATGSSAHLSGHIDLATKWGDGHGHGNSHNNRNHGHSGHGNDDDSDSSNLLQYLNEAGYEVHAYFPDATTEVTSAIHLTSDLQYSFVTPALSAANQNVLSIMVTKLTPSSQKLISVQAKLNQKILSFTEVLHRQQALHANSGKIQSIQALIAVLQKISQRITDKLAPRTEILAENHFAVQVDNKVAAASFNSTLMGNFRVTTSFNVGSAIEGEKVKVTSTVTRLGDVSDDDAISDDDDDAHDYAGYWTSPKWIAKFLWQGSQVFQSAAQALAPGASVSYTYDTPALSPSSHSQDNVFSISVHSIYDSWTGPELANLSLKEPVASDNSSPAWILAGSTPDAQHAYVKTMQPIFSQVQDSFGLIDPSGFKATLQGTLADGASTAFTADVTTKLTFQTIDQGATYQVAGDLNPVPEGIFTLKLFAEDYAQNSALPNPLSVTFRVDRTAPVTTLGINDGILTNQRNFNLPVTVTDYSPTVATITQNGVIVLESSDPAFNAPLQLQEGINIITASAVDAAQNVGAQVALYNVVLDTIAPNINVTSPAQDAVMNTLSFNISGTADEPLSSIALSDGTALTLSADKKAFTGTFVAAAEGPFTLSFLAYDLAGNLRTKDVSGKIVLKALNGNLVSVMPDPTNSQYLLVKGAQGAARPGITVTAQSSIFNAGSAVANADGSFSIRLRIFSEAIVSATDLSIPRTDTATVSYGAHTVLSGTVKDTSNNPLAGVSVSLSNTGLSTTTDGSGVFTFSEPVTGDQMLVVDGTTATLPMNSNKKFSKTRVSLSIGLNQSTVISRPIYLAPVMLDGTETIVSAGSSAVVTSPNAPGVELDIPAGSATFPDGTKSGAISMAVIDAQYSTIPVVNFARPNKVIALEPSGVTFSEPVQLTLPNENHLPAGTDVVILSMNSLKGVWEVGGAATVTSDGTEIVTKQNMGLFHFSIIYASPLGPKVTQAASVDQPGANTFDGSLSTSIAMPSYRSLGQAITPTLNYKSAWAHPRVLLTDIIDVPRNDINISKDFDFDGSPGYNNYSITQRGHGWIQPDYLTGQFLTTNVAGDTAKFTGLPNQAAVSYSLDLKNPNTNSYLGTDIYPYLSHWELHLNQMVVSTVQIREWSADTGAQSVVSETTSTTAKALGMFPTDHQGTIYVNNKMNSAAGAGWMIGGAQTITNVHGDRLLIEEADGSLAGYAIDNTITTLFNGTSQPVDFSLGASFYNFPTAIVAQSNGIASIDLSQNNPTLRTINHSPLPNETGRVIAFEPYESATGWFCQYFGWDYAIQRHLNSMFQTPGGDTYGVDTRMSQIYKIDASGVYSVVAGQSMAANNYVHTNVFSGASPVWASGDYYVQGCSNCTLDRNGSGGNWAIVDAQNALAGWSPDQNNFVLNTGFNTGGGVFPPNTCPQVVNAPYQSSGLAPNYGFQGDGASALTATFNQPSVITAGPGNSLVVADTGNNRVRLIDLTAGTIKTIAGNGQTFDSGDGGLATDASIYHPRGVVYDTIGNLYVSNDTGYIRKVDTLGRISTFAGLPPSLGGVFGDKVDAQKAAFRNPYGMVVDNNSGYLYIADTGNNRVVRIDFLTNTAATVVGNGSNGFNGDNIPALSASLSSPKFVGLDNNNNLLIADSGNSRIRRVVFQNVANGLASYSSSSQDHTKLTHNADQTWTRTYRNGTKVFFDSMGHQSSSLDRVGRQTALAYDVNSNVISITDPVGRSTFYNYSGGKLSTITDPANRTTSFVYSGNQLQQVVFPDGSRRTYGYNPDGLLASETNERGFTTQYTYNQWGRLASVTRADNTTITINDSGSATAANGYTGGSSGTLQTFGTNQGQTYDGIKDAKNIETKFIKDTLGMITTIVDGKGQTTTIQRDSKGKPTTITRPDGSTVIYNYDSATDDLLSQSDSALGITTSQTFDSYGNQLTITNGRGYTSNASYDPITGLLLTKTDPLGHGGNSTYGILGLISSSTNAVGKQSFITYDAAGNVATVKDPLSFVVSMQRDLAGNVISTTNPKGQTTINTFDSFNRLTSVTTPKNETTVYSYNLDGSLAQITDPLGNIVTFSYDELGRLIRKKDQLGFVNSLSYDANGNIASDTDANGNYKQYTYDNLNRIILKTLPDNVVSMSYDIRGNLTQAANQQSILNVGYDDGGRVISAQTQGQGTLANFPSVTLGFKYDANGNRTELHDSEGTTQYSYDQADRLYSITNPKGETYGFGFDSVNRLQAMSRPGSNTTFAFDDRNFLTSIVHAKNGGVAITSFGYQLDQIGYRTQVSFGSTNRALFYDNNNQLIQETNPEAPAAASGFANETFTYDSISNRTIDQGGNYTFDNKSQRLVQDYRYFYFYDNNGNLISKQAKFGLVGQTTSFTYSSENQLLSFQVFDPGSNIPSKEVTYVYDATGRRIQKQVIDHTGESDPTKSFVRRYAYDGQEILFEYDGSNNLLARYTHSSLRTDDVLAVDIKQAGVNVALAQNAGTYQYLKDAQGTVTDICDNNGNKLQHYIYSAFGSILGIQDAFAADIGANPIVRTSFAYTGREFDSESGYYYSRARFYDSRIGRFLQKDPAPGRLDLAVSVINSYVYAGDNPANYQDPSGKSFWTDVRAGIKGAIAGYVLGGPLGALVGGVLGFTGAVDEATINKALIIEAIVIVGVIAGITLGPIGGAIIGGIAGGLIGGTFHNDLGYQHFWQGFWFGAQIGALAGGVAGGLAEATESKDFWGCVAGAALLSAAIVPIISGLKTATDKGDFPFPDKDQMTTNAGIGAAAGIAQALAVGTLNRSIRTGNIHGECGP